MSFLDHTDFGSDAYRTCALSRSSADIPSCNDVVVPAVHAVREDISVALVANPDPEASPPEFSSDDIDRGRCLGMFHPVTGDCIIGATFDEAQGVYIVEHVQSGWGSHETTRNALPRIGDGKPHSEKDLPLAHWVFDSRTRILLKK